MGYILLIAFALLIFFGAGAAGDFLKAVVTFAAIALPVGSVLAAIQRFIERKFLAGIGWIIAAILWAWVFGWI